MNSVGIFIIGDELLHGEIKDQNGPWLIQQFNERGISVRHCCILPDDPQIIADELRRFSDCDYLVTTGGIGPTHDDRTLEAVGLALDRPLETDEEMIQFLEANHEELNKPQKKMALRPKGGEFYNLEQTVGLAFVIDNVYVFPGFPELLKPLFFKLEDNFEGKPLMTETLETQGLESDIAGLLAKFQDEYPNLQFGSYPHTDRTIILKIRGRNPDLVQEATTKLQSQL